MGMGAQHSASQGLALFDHVPEFEAWRPGGGEQWQNSCFLYTRRRNMSRKRRLMEPRKGDKGYAAVGPRGQNGLGDGKPS